MPPHCLTPQRSLTKLSQACHIHQRHNVTASRTSNLVTHVIFSRQSCSSPVIVTHVLVFTSQIMSPRLGHCSLICRTWSGSSANFVTVFFWYILSRLSGSHHQKSELQSVTLRQRPASSLSHSARGLRHLCYFSPKGLRPMCHSSSKVCFTSITFCQRSASLASHFVKGLRHRCRTSPKVCINTFTHRHRICVTCVTLCQRLESLTSHFTKGLLYLIHTSPNVCHLCHTSPKVYVSCVAFR